MLMWRTPMWVKICGIRDEAGVAAAVDAGPDAVGFNFFPPSPRFVDIERAANLTKALPASISSVGVFVNESPDDVVRICRETKIVCAQLHGDETPGMVARIRRIAPGLKLIRAFRVGDDGLAEVDDFMRAIRELELDLFACLIDARVENVYGGSGRRAPWNLLADDYDVDNWPPLILAGGLNPENVQEAIQTVHPWGVDVAGGVESSPGVKDKTLVHNFVQAARG